MSEHIVDLIRAIYQHHQVGGHLHIVLDDGNCEDGDLEFCDRFIDDPDEYPNEWGLGGCDRCRPGSALTAAECMVRYERECLAALRPLSVEERERVIGQAQMCWRPYYEAWEDG